MIGPIISTVAMTTVTVIITIYSDNGDSYRDGDDNDCDSDNDNYNDNENDNDNDNANDDNIRMSSTEQSAQKCVMFQH